VSPPPPAPPPPPPLPNTPAKKICLHTRCTAVVGGRARVHKHAMDTVLSVLAPVGVTDERGLLLALAGAMAAAGASAFVALTGFAVAPYGKYADKAAWFYGPPINGKVAWIIQEAPSFFVPAYCWWAASSAGGPTAAQLSSLTPRSVLLGMLLAHYANRTFIFPLQIRGGKPTPLVIMLMAFVFCMWNG
jgi:3-oxo-5-alpha-steroid 4-dehydrogenase 1